MNNSKVWMVLGAANGLGYAAVKYLVANNQFVIALADADIAAFPAANNPSGYLRFINVDMSDPVQVKNNLAIAGAEHWPIDFIINNSNYQLFHQSANKTNVQIQTDIETATSATVDIITTLLPYLRKGQGGSVINIPPQLCLASIPDKAVAEKLAWGMDTFLTTMQASLKKLNCGLTFLQPGERLGEFTV